MGLNSAETDLIRPRWNCPGVLVAPLYVYVEPNSKPLQNDDLKNDLVYMLDGTRLFDVFYKMILCFRNANMQNMWPNRTFFQNPRVQDVNLSKSPFGTKHHVEFTGKRDPYTALL